MKLPALWIGVAFAIGICAGLRWPERPVVCAAAVAVAIVAGGILVWYQRNGAAAICVLTAWFALGGLALGIESATVPSNHVTRLLAQNRIDLTEPVRWRGRLREDPLVMPWGQRFEIDIEQVVIAGETISASGGLRVNLYGGTEQTGS